MRKDFLQKKYAKNNDSCKDHFKVHMSWAGGRGGTVFSLYFCFNLKISQFLLNNPNIYNLAFTLFWYLKITKYMSSPNGISYNNT